MGKQLAYITGHKARSAVQESMALLDEIQRDTVAFAIAGALNDNERLEEIGRGMITKMQRVEALLWAALRGRFEDVEQEQKT